MYAVPPSPPDLRDGVAVVLSAGASERFGGRPKALLPVGPELAIARIVRLCREEGFPRVVVVAGPHAESIRSAVARGSAEVVVNDDWATGRTGSVQVGLAAAAAGGPVLLWPVDHPFVEGSTLSALVFAAQGDALAVWFIPTYGGQGGHPVLLRGSATGAVAELSAATPLRAVLPRLGPQVRRVPVRDPGVVAPVETPEAYRSALSEWERRTGTT